MGEARAATLPAGLPVLHVVGDRDPLRHCPCHRCVAARGPDAAAPAVPAAGWSRVTPDVERLVVADQGHNLTMHRNAGAATTASADWIDGVVPAA
jgi:hypothetical protein